MSRPFVPGDHPRGGPNNAGQFTAKTQLPGDTELVAAAGVSTVGQQITDDDLRAEAGGWSLQPHDALAFTVDASGNHTGGALLVADTDTDTVQARLRSDYPHEALRYVLVDDNGTLTCGDVAGPRR